ncbi:MAG: CBS domain-containing protein [Pseudomonadota bacterium]
MQSLKVKDYMTKKLVTVTPKTNVVEAMDLLLSNSVSGTPVVDAEGNLVGVLSEADLLHVIIQDSYYDESVGIVEDYMKAPVETVDANMDIYTLAEKFTKEHRRRYPVVHQGKLVGQISRRDVLKAAEDFLKHRV